MTKCRSSQVLYSEVISMSLHSREAGPGDEWAVRVSPWCSSQPTSTSESAGGSAIDGLYPDLVLEMRPVLRSISAQHSRQHFL